MIHFSDKQRSIIRKPFKDNSLEVLEGSPRSGKTTALVFRYALFLLKTEDENHLILGFNQEQAYKLIIESDGMGLAHIFPSATIKDGEFGKHLYIDTPKGVRRVFYKGGGKADDYKRFQGLSLGSVLFTEINLVHMDVIQEAFRRTFASQLRCHFADLNPPAPQHPIIKEVFEVQNTDWSHWTMNDNPILTDNRKEELRKILERNPYLYQRDWLGQRVIPQGVIYSMWSEKNQFAKIPDNEQIVEMYFSADGGVEHATSVICWIVTIDSRDRRKKGLYNANEYFYSGQDTGTKRAMSLQAKDIVKDFIPYCKNRFQREWSHVFVDPACLVLIEELRLLGIEAERADNNAHDIKGSSKGIMVGIERCQNLMTDLTLRTLDDSRYGHYDFLKELSTYVVDDKGVPVGIHDDTQDAMRYGANYFWKTYIK